ncbi:hypothetical protein M0L63_RS16325 [Providencia rettgeri]|nr:hypothetical protein [Providencia rettgeri]ELR5238805.1 hypothetical protein [Providencia rettgeri]
MTIQTTDTPLLNDQFIDMKFITKLTGLTDKWFYKLIQDGEFPKSKFPFLALSLHNFVPAGDRCNSRFKKILRW